MKHLLTKALMGIGIAVFGIFALPLVTLIAAHKAMALVKNEKQL